MDLSLIELDSLTKIKKLILNKESSLTIDHLSSKYNVRFFKFGENLILIMEDGETTQTKNHFYLVDSYGTISAKVETFIKSQFSHFTNLSWIWIHDNRINGHEVYLIERTPLIWSKEDYRCNWTTLT